VDITHSSTVDCYLIDSGFPRCILDIVLNDPVAYKVWCSFWPLIELSSQKRRRYIVRESLVAWSAVKISCQNSNFIENDKTLAAYPGGACSSSCISLSLGSSPDFSASDGLVEGYKGSIGCLSSNNLQVPIRS